MVYLSRCNYEQIRNELEAFSTGWLYAFMIKEEVYYVSDVLQCLTMPSAVWMFQCVCVCVCVLIFIVS